jgi:GTP:adenosylcobinamide-phosphate guanylyltransferase
LDLGGRDMLDYIISALKESSMVGRVIVVAPPDSSGAPWSGPVDAVLPAGPDIVENLKVALDFLKDAKRGDKVLFMTCDIPLVTAAAIDDFLAQCAAFDADVFYPVLTKQTMEKAYPGTQRTYFKLKEGTFTGGNIALLDSVVVSENLGLIEEAFALRKSVPKLMRILGPKFVMKLATRSLSMGDLEARVGNMINARSKIIESRYAEIGIDVDKVSDIELVKNYINAA